MWLYFLSWKLYINFHFAYFSSVLSSCSKSKWQEDQDIKNRKWRRICLLTIHSVLVGRKNHAIVEMVRNKIKGKYLFNSFWAEALYTIAYTLSQLPRKSLEAQLGCTRPSQPSAKYCPSGLHDSYARSRVGRVLFKP